MLMLGFLFFVFFCSQFGCPWIIFWGRPVILFFESFGLKIVTKLWLINIILKGCKRWTERDFEKTIFAVRILVIERMLLTFNGEMLQIQLPCFKIVWVRFLRPFYHTFKQVCPHVSSRRLQFRIIMGSLKLVKQKLKIYRLIKEIVESFSVWCNFYP